MKKNSLHKLLLGSLTIIVVLFFFVVYTTPVTHGVSVPFFGDTENPGDYVKGIYTFGLGLGALLAMVMIVVGAVQYTMSEAVTSKEDAKDRITKAIWGLVLLLAATLIFLTINPQITQLDSLEKLDIDKAGTDPSEVVEEETTFCGDGIVQYPNGEGVYEECDPPGEYTGEEKPNFPPYVPIQYQQCFSGCFLWWTETPPF